MATPYLQTDLTKIQYYKDDCIELEFRAIDIGGNSIDQYATVTFTVDNTFANIPADKTFIIYGKSYSTGIAPNTIDLSSANVESNLARFAEFLYNRFELNGLFLPPDSYGDAYYTYDAGAGTGEIKIIFVDAGLIDPFEFDVSNLTGMTSVVFAGVSGSGRSNYAVLYKAYLGVHAISDFFALPLLSKASDKLPKIDLKYLLQDYVRTSDLAIYSATNFVVLDDNIYKEFYLRVGAKWTTEGSCSQEVTTLYKTELIRVWGTDQKYRKVLSSFVRTKLCRLDTVNRIWVKGEFDKYKVSYSNGINTTVITHNIPLPIKDSVHSISMNRISIISDIGLTGGLSGVHANNVKTITLDMMYQGGVYTSHVFDIVECDCCSQFYYERYNGGWESACLTPEKEFVDIVRSETCLFGCGENTTSNVKSKTRSVTYTAENMLIMDMITSPKVYYEENGKLYEVRIKAGKFDDKTTKITIEG